MKDIKYFFLATAVLALSAFTWKTVTKWKIDENYSIRFVGTDAEGIFKKLSGEVVFEESNLESSSFSFVVDVNSINTGNGMKNKHAISDKWFDAEEYPNISFKSTNFTKSKVGYSVNGELTMHGISKKMTVPFTFEKDVVAAKFSVKRLDFKVGTMEGNSKKVSDEIKLDVSIPLIK